MLLDVNNLFFFFSSHSSDNDSYEGNAAYNSDEEIIVHAAPINAVPVPVNLLLNPNGHEWFDNGEVSYDRGLSNRRTRLVWPGNVNLVGDALAERTELDYFRLFYPMQLNHVTLLQTNAKLDPTGRKAIDESELLTYYGLRLNMTLDRRKLEVPEYWEDISRPGSTFIPPDYGRFGMTRHRFQAISRCLRFSNYDEGIVGEASIFNNMLRCYGNSCKFHFCVSSGSLDSNSSFHRCVQC